MNRFSTYSAYGMNHAASAACAEASSACAFHTCENSITAILGAIFMASIIITLISLVSVLGLSLLVVVLLVVAALIIRQLNMPRARGTA